MPTDLRIKINLIKQLLTLTVTYVLFVVFFNIFEFSNLAIRVNTKSHSDEVF